MAEGLGKVGSGPGPCTCSGLKYFTSVLVCVIIAFSLYIVSVVCLIIVLLSETDNSDGEIEKVFNKSLWRVNDNLKASHKMLFLMVLISCLPDCRFTTFNACGYIALPNMCCLSYYKSINYILIPIMA